MNKKILILVPVIIGTILVGLFYSKNKQLSQTTQSSPTTHVSQNTQVPELNSNSSNPNSNQNSHMGRETSSTPSVQNNLASSTAISEVSKSSTQTPITQASQRPTCYRALFNHPPIASHQDGEACLHHKNQITLNHEQINRASVCVRVNGTPVAHTVNSGKSMTVTIGAVAGPHAEINVQYCTGKVVCNDPCKIPKDEFMSALGGEDSDTTGGSWDAGSGPSADEKALQGELKSLDQETKGDSEKLSLFKGWTLKSEAEFCQGNQKVKR